MNEMEEDVTCGRKYSKVLDGTRLGLAFRSLMAPNRHGGYREKILDFYRRRVLVIPLREDKVMPLKGVFDLMWNGEKRNSNVKVMHFKFPYIHENPFPVNTEGACDLLDQAFNKVFRLSSDYLSS